MKLAFIARPDKAQAIQAVKEAIEVAKELGLSVAIEPKTAEKLGEVGTPLEEIQADVAMTFGGDGTLLYAARSLDPSIPLLGVNLGETGALTEVEPGEVSEALSRLKSGDFSIEEVLKLSVSAGDESFPDAINECLVSTGDPGKVLQLEVSLGDEKFSTKADGLLVSTPLGSSGHSYSAGGPLVSKELEAAVVVPICACNYPHPRVVPLSCGISIKQVRPGRRGVIVIDGCHVGEFVEGATLKVGRSEKSAKFVRLN